MRWLLPINYWIVIIMIVTHELLGCNEIIVAHKLLDCNAMIVTHKLLGCNDCNPQVIGL